MALYLDHTNEQILYAAPANSGVYKSTDGGVTWQVKNYDMDPNEPITSIVIDPVRPNVVYAGSLFSGMYLSEDGGDTWRLLNDGLRTRAVAALSISSDGETLYAGTQGEGVFRLSTLSQSEFDELTPPDPVTEADKLGIQIDGVVDDWSSRMVLHEDPSGDTEQDFLDLTTGYAFLTGEALYFAVAAADPGASVVQFDITLNIDSREIMITLAPRSDFGGFNDFNNIGFSGRTVYSDFAFIDVVEGRVDLRDLNFPTRLRIVRVSVVAEDGGDRIHGDNWEPGIDLP